MEGATPKELVPFIDVHAHLTGGDHSGAAQKAFYLIQKQMLNR